MRGGGRTRWNRYGRQPGEPSDVDPKHRVSCEELFGPAVAVTPFGSFDEALALANGTNYGLSASIFTQDVNAGTVTGSPAWTAAWRAGFCPSPEASTHPIKHSSTLDGSIAALISRVAAHAVAAGGELGAGRNSQEQDCRKDHGRNRRKVAAELGEMEGRGSEIRIILFCGAAI